MAATTFVATTAEGNTVARTSATRDYNFVVLAKINVGGKNTADDKVEGAWGWSADAVNAEKAAVQARKVYTSVRVVPVEQKVTGREAKLILEAIKATPVDGSGSPYVGGAVRSGAQPMGKITAPATTGVKEMAAAEKKAAASKKAAKATSPVAHVVAALTTTTEKGATTVKEAKPEFDSTEFEALLAEVTAAQAALTQKLNERNAMIDSLIKSGQASGPKLAKIMNVTPMAVYNMQKKVG